MIVVLQAETLDNWQGPGTTAVLRIAALDTFTTAEGQMIAGEYEPFAWYRDVTCTVGTRTDGQGAVIRTLQIPAVEIPATADSPDNPQARFSFSLRGATETEFHPLPGFGSVSIPAQTPRTWEQILNYNRLPEPAPADWRNQVLSLISSSINVTVPLATATVHGKVALSVAPSSPSNPIAASVNDPRLSPATNTQDGLLTAAEKRLLTPHQHDQAVAASVWTITHNRDRQYPDVHVFDSAGNEVEGDISYTTNQLVITFSAAFSGVAFVD